MNKEEAIKQLEIILQNIIEERKQGIASIEGIKFQEALQAVLNLIQKQDKIIDNAIKEVEKIRCYFGEDVQVEFIRVLEILKDKNVKDW